MTDPNLARNLFVVSGAVIACLGLTACAGQSAEVIPTDPAAPITANSNNQPSIERTFNQNGTEVTVIYDPSDKNGQLTRITSYCEGPDLIDATTIRYIGYGAAGGSIARSPKHSACADGRLDPADFAQK